MTNPSPSCQPTGIGGAACSHNAESGGRRQRPQLRLSERRDIKHLAIDCAAPLASSIQNSPFSASPGVAYFSSRASPSPSQIQAFETESRAFAGIEYRSPPRTPPAYGTQAPSIFRTMTPFLPSILRMPPRLSSQLHLHASGRVKRSYGKFAGGRLAHASIEIVGERGLHEDFIDDRIPYTGDPTHHAVFVSTIYDGHGGAKAASLVHQSGILPTTFLKCEHSIEAGFKAESAFMSADERLADEYERAPFRSGTTVAVVALYPIGSRVKNAASVKAGTVKAGAAVSSEPTKSQTAYPLVAANTGDTEAVIFSRKEPPRKVTTEHSAASEEERVVQAGGFVLGGRVNGELAISRALGDFGFKQSPDGQRTDCGPVIAKPSVKFDALDEGELLIVASDGLWNGIESLDAFGKEILQALDVIGSSALAPALERAAHRAAVTSHDDTTVSAVYYTGTCGIDCLEPVYTP